MTRRSLTLGPAAGFGVLRPNRLQNAVRRRARRLPANGFGRKLASALLGLAGGRKRRAYDVAVFGTEKARLHPYDNICEKRVFMTPQLWDPAERALLAERIAAGEGAFTFVDVGANAGLYSLFAASAARAANRPIRIVAIEADPVMCVRMAFNFAVSRIRATVLPYAATGGYGAVQLEVNEKSRGMSRLVAEGGEAVEGAPLDKMLGEWGIETIDAMKIDIEGAEFDALESFFAGAPQTLWPTLLLLETSHDDIVRSARALALTQGYSAILETDLNTIYERRAKTETPET